MYYVKINFESSNIIIVDFILLSLEIYEYISSPY